MALPHRLDDVVSRAVVWTVATALLATVTLLAQYTTVTSSGTLPTCAGNGGVYVKTGASSGLYWCLGGSWSGPAGAATGDVAGPGSATDNAVTRFDSTTGKLIQNSAVTLDDNGVFAFPDGQRQTFNPNGTTPGFNVGAHTADPSGLSDGDCWYNSTSTQLKCRINGTTTVIGGSSSASGTHRVGWTWPSGSATTGTHPFVISIPVGGTITRVRLWADTSCSAVVDFWKETYANFSASQPDNSDSVPSTDEPELSSAQKYETTSFGSYATTTLSTGDMLKANIDSNSGCSTLQLQIDYTE